MEADQPSPDKPRKKTTSAAHRKSLACEYCHRSFARLEHLQRHLRTRKSSPPAQSPRSATLPLSFANIGRGFPKTDTKEKPFSCDICSKSFARSDLLVRHERLVHPGEAATHRGERRSGTDVKASHQTIPLSPASMIPPAHHEPRVLDMHDPIGIQQPPPPHPPVPPPEVQVHHAPLIEPNHFNPSWGYDLNLLSHAASHVALENQQELALESIRKPHLPTGPSPQLQAAVQEKSIADAYSVEPSFLDLTDLGDPVQDFTVFLESVGLSTDWDSGVFSSVETDPLLSNSIQFDTKPPGREYGQPRLNPDILSEQRASADEAPSFSNFGSRLPSLQPEPQESDERASLLDDPTNPRPAWDISNTDRQLFLTRLDEFAHVLPRGFVPPSRHALSRFIAGYINGLNEHLPFIHVPTLSVVRCLPELTLALAAAGSHYRFENSRGIELFHAAKAILFERIRRRDAKQVPTPTWDVYVPSTPSQRSSMAPSNAPGSPFQAQKFPPQLESMSYMMDESEAHMEVIQTFLLLTVFASWERQPELLREILALQSTLARLVREHGLSDSSIVSDNLAWDEWARLEGNRRTKLIVYCFFNLHSIMYNIPPLIMNSELNLRMPCAHEIWKANNASQWRRIYRSRHEPIVTFQDAFAKLFLKTPPPNPCPISPLGNYILIHAIIQQIFFARQLRITSPLMPSTSLRAEDLTALENALNAWKAGWKRTPGSSIDPQNPAGPIAFTSTALLGLAYIRLHLDMGPCRRLVTQDPLQIARALQESPPIVRSPKLIMALLHSAHALSIPVRLGIDFVARTHSFFWSIQHSLCSLECAFLLSEWLLSIPLTQSEQRLSDHERKLLLWIKSMMDETDMAIATSSVDGHDLDFTQDPFKVRRLSVAVVRVWARTFKGNTSWAIVDLIGSSLEAYADLLEG